MSLAVRYIFLTLLMVVLPVVALGQNWNSGEIRGTVRDASGAVVPGAKIIITNTLTGVVTDLKTNDAGKREVPD